MANPILPDFSVDFKNMSEQKIRKLTGQDEGDFFQNSIEIDFSTGLFGDKDNLISNYIIKEIQDNQLPFTVRNKQENISVLVANLFKIHILNCRPYSRTYMDANEFTKIRIKSCFNMRNAVRFNGFLFRFFLYCIFLTSQLIILSYPLYLCPIQSYVSCLYEYGRWFWFVDHSQVNPGDDGCLYKNPHPSDA